VANDLLFSGMKKEGKKILWLLMLLWKNYGGGRPAAIQTRPDRAAPVRDSDRIAAQAIAHFPTPCFSHKTLRGHVLRRVPACQIVFHKVCPVYKKRSS